MASFVVWFPQFKIFGMEGEKAAAKFGNRFSIVLEKSYLPPQRIYARAPCTDPPAANGGGAGACHRPDAPISGAARGLFGIPCQPHGRG